MKCDVLFVNVCAKQLVLVLNMRLMLKVSGLWETCVDVTEDEWSLLNERSPWLGNRCYRCLQFDKVKQILGFALTRRCHYKTLWHYHILFLNPVLITATGKLWSSALTRSRGGGIFPISSSSASAKIIAM